MADFQYQPDPNDRIVKLREAMDKLDGESPLPTRHDGGNIISSSG